MAPGCEKKDMGNKTNKQKRGPEPEPNSFPSKSAGSDLSSDSNLLTCEVSQKKTHKAASSPPPPVNIDIGPSRPNKESEPSPDEFFDLPDLPSIDAGSKSLSSGPAFKTEPKSDQSKSAGSDLPSDSSPLYIPEAASSPPHPLNIDKSSELPMSNKGSEPPSDHPDPPLDTGSKSRPAFKTESSPPKKISRQERRRAERAKRKFKGI